MARSLAYRMQYYGDHLPICAHSTCTYVLERDLENAYDHDDPLPKFAANLLWRPLPPQTKFNTDLGEQSLNHFYATIWLTVVYTRLMPRLYAEWYESQFQASHAQAEQNFNVTWSDNHLMLCFNWNIAEKLGMDLGTRSWCLWVLTTCTVHVYAWYHWGVRLLTLSENRMWAVGNIIIEA